MIPVLKLSSDNLPKAFEKAVIAVWYRGRDIKTKYDKPEDPPSKDATVIIEVHDPLAEPRIHKNFPGGLQDLEIYRQEVVNGIHNHWVGNEGWSYTYNNRLTNYEGINQLDMIVDKLVTCPHNRRVQAITWMPDIDIDSEHSPCMQRLWFRISKYHGTYYLNLNSHWRSRDLYKAWFMNAYAITDLQRIIAEQVSTKLGYEVQVGRYVDISDSLHIYGSYFDEVTTEVHKMKTSPYEERTWDSQKPVIVQIIEETKGHLQEDPDFMKH